MHPILAIRVFFAVLFGRPLRLDVLPEHLLQPPTASSEDAPAGPVHEEPSTDGPAEGVAKPPSPEAPKTVVPEGGPAPEAVAVQSLAMFQTEGRLVDFLLEDIEAYSDEDVGAAVREVHRGCKRALSDHFDLEPVRPEKEESMVSVPGSYDPGEMRLVGHVVGAPPFSGTLKHKGWRATAVRLPKVPDGAGAMVVTPAEVEI